MHIDILTASQLLTAIGTLALAGVAVTSIRSSNATVRHLSEQLRYQRSQLIPYVNVTEWHMEGNRVHATLENPTKAMALWVGLRADFFVVDVATYAAPDASGKRLSEEQAAGICQAGGQVYGKYELAYPVSRQKLKHEGTTVEHVGVTTFAVTGLCGALLRPESSAAVQFVPRFGVRKLRPRVLQTFDFEELRPLLERNRLSHFAVSLALVYKDISEAPVGYDTLANFAAPLDEAPSLEAAYASNHLVDFIALSHSQMTGPKLFFDDALYRCMRTDWSRDEANE
ncbi:MAG: hypothetical protein M0R22_01565 [Dehalococcoidia bacterium]|jgi:hypothetical protein|nr:hypothetical protein [Dehalococcoidia bacterium]